MSKATKRKQKTELIMGLCAIALSVLFFVALFSGIGWLRDRLNQLSASLPTSIPTSTMPPPTDPKLIPNPFAPGDFVYAQGYLTCPSGNYMLGVDVSEYQGNIDWQTVASEGIGFAMVRIGGRGWGESGQIFTDTYWQRNLDGAQDAGLLTGVYFFSQAISEEEAREEARFVIEQLDGRELTLPVVFDWETIGSADARTADLSPWMLNRCAMAFCEEIRAAGYQPMVYFNQSLALDMLDLPTLQQQGYPFWLAMYTDALTYPHRVEMWQYTSEGTVAGIQGFVDLDLYFIYE